MHPRLELGNFCTKSMRDSRCSTATVNRPWRNIYIHLVNNDKHLSFTTLRTPLKLRLRDGATVVHEVYGSKRSLSSVRFLGCGRGQQLCVLSEAQSELERFDNVSQTCIGQFARRQERTHYLRHDLNGANGDSDDKGVFINHPLCACGARVTLKFSSLISRNYRRLFRTTAARFHDSGRLIITPPKIRPLRERSTYAEEEERERMKTLVDERKRKNKDTWRTSVRRRSQYRMPRLLRSQFRLALATAESVRGRAGFRLKAFSSNRSVAEAVSKSEAEVGHFCRFAPFYGGGVPTGVKQ
ncbi:hypothetical protein EVAR_10686_1 [Eumeta japonica]|uniref:Uncharacterized protein n=1 Tax=Eumeta variegata TaxID=151549 RepID=A0A4C1U8H3_EUMVA|nr:hypothetical protein EVAR_10686_1 [Eumeta japonica]